ncbi:Mating-type protein A2 [Frankliniella fusca]|uniref:Mating-type protein A2 n=1 Tax=Frankliniella fusca TaxID=407009 RepID=A0AAE1GUA8_9NEOP|nr:Mating-type protein A2 [Frankliniella fusca]
MAHEKVIHDFWECKFLEDPNDELKKHEKLAAKNAAKSEKNYEKALQLYSDVLDLSEAERKIKDGTIRVRKLKVEKEIMDSKLSKIEETNQSLLEECQNLSMTTSEKRNSIPALAQESENLKQTLTAIKNDVLSERKQFKQRNDCVLKLKDLYKKNLNCHLRRLKTEDESELYLFTFDSTVKPVDKDSMPFRSIKFQRIYSGPDKTDDPKYATWKIIETSPQLPNFEKISSIFAETQDIHGLLAYLKKQWKSKRLNQ